MAPPSRRLTVLARALAATAALVAAMVVPARVDAYVTWGTVLVPGYQWAGQESAGLGDLNVYSNGDGNQDQVGSFGLSYECVELAQRFAAVRFGEQRIWPVSAAYQMWTAGPNLSIPFVQHANGGADAPQAGDLLIFDHVSGAPYGHVAVVADSGPDYVDIVEQNWNNSSPTGSSRLAISGTTMPARAGIPIIGWLRSSNASAPYKPVVITKAGQVFGYAGATTYGGPASLALAQPLVGAVGTPTGKGYWMVGGDGGIFSYGDAQFYGSTGNIVLNQPIVGMATTPDGKGYWLVASDGGVFAFGDAAFYGSTGNIKLNKPVVGMASTPTGKGYWLVASDGGIFAFGDAPFLGSTGNIVLNKPVNGMAATHDGKGYWMVASDGGMFAFGDAGFYGSTGNITVPSPVARMTTTNDGKGYWLATTGGTVYAFGDAKYLANTGTVPVNGSPVVGLVTTLTQQ
jgi:hypothetical protein